MTKSKLKELILKQKTLRERRRQAEILKYKKAKKNEKR